MITGEADQMPKSKEIPEKAKSQVVIKTESLPKREGFLFLIFFSQKTSTNLTPFQQYFLPPGRKIHPLEVELTLP